MTMRRYELMVGPVRTDEVTLEHLATRAGLHPAVMEQFVEYGLIEPITAHGRMFLIDSSKIRRLGSIQRLRGDLGINLAGVAVVLDLLERLLDLERENAFLRAQL